MSRLPSNASCTNPRLNKAVQYVAGDLSVRPSLSTVAKVAGLEKAYFSMCFRREFGLTFTEWHTRLRAQEARRLLTNTSVSITAVALAVGYADVTTFERNFRKMFSVL